MPAQIMSAMPAAAEPAPKKTIKPDKIPDTPEDGTEDVDKKKGDAKTDGAKKDDAKKGDAKKGDAKKGDAPK